VIRKPVPIWKRFTRGTTEPWIGVSEIELILVTTL
jgi:hypothetical protein